jgi:3-polyprenyl-4-hydroxybenzoate decarboxylase
MFEITARILTIHLISDKSAQVVLKKQVKGKQVAIAINVFGFWKEKFDALKLQKNDKIVGRVFVKSEFYKTKWYTEFYFNEVKRFVAKPKYDPYTQTYGNPVKKNTENELFEDADNIGNNYIIDDETGEILL